MAYDIIGDIHGQARKLEQLLLQMDYRQVDGVYRHPERKAVFVGDFIDRGPEQRRTLDIVRRMVEGGHAFAVMGNHEFNAICYHTRRPGGGPWLREHSEGKTKQHRAFLREFPLDDERTREVIAWFRTLPLFLELEGIRVVHACWEQNAIARLRARLNRDNTLTDELIIDAATEGTQAFADIETILKGPEAGLPDGLTFHDKDGNVRDSVRIRWWGAAPGDVGSAAFHPAHVPEPIRATPLEDVGIEHYPVPAPSGEEVPVFFGHYWCSGDPQPRARNVACVDYSAGANGPLVAYRWQGRPTLSGEHFVTSEHGPFSLGYLEAAHGVTLDEKLLRASPESGCFYCLSVIPNEELLASADGVEICPRCGIDSLVPSNAGFPLSRAFLSEMRRVWFEGGHPYGDESRGADQQPGGDVFV